MEKGLVSVIIPVYNVEKYLEECINSVLNQTYKNLEVILIDDGSTDSSGKMCDELLKRDKRIKVFHKENGGLSDARNYGIDRANGEYIQFVDSDDFIDEKMIEIMYDEIIKNDADISLSSFYIYDDYKTEDKIIPADLKSERIVFSNEEAIKEFLLDNKIRGYVWNKFFKKKLFNNIRFEKGIFFEDSLIIPKLFLEAKRIAMYNIPLYYYRQRQGSILHTQTKELRKAFIDVENKVENFALKNIKNSEKYVNYNLAHVALMTFNDIGIFELDSFKDEQFIKDLYNKFKIIFSNKEQVKFIIENSSEIENIHYFYLYYSSDEYIKNNIYLPVMFKEHKSIVEKRLKR